MYWMKHWQQMMYSDLNISCKDGQPVEIRRIQCKTGQTVRQVASVLVKRCTGLSQCANSSLQRKFPCLVQERYPQVPSLHASAQMLDLGDTVCLAFQNMVVESQ